TYEKSTSTISACYFFFKRCLHHHNLHSFPTRRSSDLQATLSGAGYTLATWYHENYNAVNSSAMDEPIGYEEFAMQSQRFLIGSRSEEHTSELQSLRHLVCRLLLEKKKKKK